MLTHRSPADRASCCSGPLVMSPIAEHALSTECVSTVGLYWVVQGGQAHGTALIRVDLNGGLLLNTHVTSSVFYYLGLLWMKSPDPLTRLEQ